MISNRLGLQWTVLVGPELGIQYIPGLLDCWKPDKLVILLVFMITHLVYLLFSLIYLKYYFRGKTFIQSTKVVSYQAAKIWHSLLACKYVL